MSAAMLPKALPAASEDAEEIARMQRLFERQRLAFEAAPSAPSRRIALRTRLSGSLARPL